MVFIPDLQSEKLTLVTIDEAKDITLKKQTVLQNYARKWLERAKAIQSKYIKDEDLAEDLSPAEIKTGYKLNSPGLSPSGIAPINRKPGLSKFVN